MTQHVAVLMGGHSAERDVSLVSGAACAKALRENGYQVTEIDVGDDVAARLVAAKPDVAFNALHGQWGEDGCIQGLLELLRIPYTHSGVMSSAMAMDKPMAKQIFEAAGLQCAHGVIATREQMIAGDPIARPYVAKPSNEGSSVGVKILFKDDGFAFTKENWPYGDAVLVETYIPGREITAAVLDGKALGVTEIRPLDGFYDYENKYTDGKTEHLCPAPLSDDLTKEVMRQAELAHKVLKCRGLSRTDFRLDESDGTPKLYVLELNTQPGMTPLSLSPEIAAYAGISFNDLVRLLVEDARLGE